jgi:protein-disulfide isomerase
MAERRGISSLGTSIFVVLVLSLLILFIWQVGKYYRLIAVGGDVALPQFSTQFTAVGKPSTDIKLADQTDTDDPSIGPADAKLVVVEFLDYQCPFSGEASSVLRESAAAYGNKVRFVIRDSPLSEIHPDALAAAEAAGCAQAQDKFWPMHDRLFALKGVLLRPNLDRVAEQSGLNMEAYRLCMDSHARLGEIEKDSSAASVAGVRGTPTFFFNGRPVEGAIPREAFAALIQRFSGS